MANFLSTLQRNVNSIKNAAISDISKATGISKPNIGISMKDIPIGVSGRGFGIKVVGAEKAIAKLNMFANDIKNKATYEILGETAKQIRDRAKLLCPVDRGDLQNSIRYYVDKKRHTAKVMASGDKRRSYAVYVEYGTSSAPAQPFMGPAIIGSEEFAIRAAEMAIKRVLHEDKDTKQYDTATEFYQNESL